MTTTKRIVYKLRLDGQFLAIENHEDETEIFGFSDEYTQPVCFDTQEEALAAICTNFFFHHGLGSISRSDSAKDRLAKIEIVKCTLVEKQEIVRPEVYVPTNIEIHNWYVTAKGDDGLRFYLNSQLGGFEKTFSKGCIYDDDGCELADTYDRIKGYNDWVKAGKPVKSSHFERITKAREVATKRKV